MARSMLFPGSYSCNADWDSDEQGKPIDRTLIVLNTLVAIDASLPPAAGIVPLIHWTKV